MKKTITLEAIDPIEIYGAGNRILEALCNYYPDTTIIARGNEIRVDGDEKSIEDFEMKINTLIEKRKHKMNLTPYDVEEMFEGESPAGIAGIRGDAVIVYGTDGKPIRARNSTQEAMVRAYFENDLATGFAKPYEDHDYRFVGLLPNKGVTVAELLESLDGEGLAELLTPAENTVVRVSLPTFTSSYDIELSGVLRALGMTDAFDAEAADFSRMGSSDAGPLFIGSVLHKTFIDVDEEGTRAAAATVTTMDGAAAPIEEEPEVKEVILDRPFVYLIVDAHTMTPVFTGTLTSAE